MAFTADERRGMKIKFEDYDNKIRRKFWLPMISRNRDNPGTTEDEGQVLLTVDLLTMEEYVLDEIIHV